MPTYSIDLKLPHSDIMEFIETLISIGGAESVQFTIDAPTRRKAVSETVELLNEFSATYQDSYLTPEVKENIEENLKLGSERPCVAI